MFKAGFDTPEQAAGLFKQLLPPTITSALAWETLARESGTFIDPQLRNRHSDLLFSIQIDREPQGEAVLLHLLLEHQSSNDTPDLDFADVHAKLLRELPETKDVVMTFAERLREQGRVEGEAKGRVEGRVEGEAKGRVQVLTKLMTLKFGPLSDDHASRIATATEHQLDAYIERILIASTPEAMFTND